MRKLIIIAGIAAVLPACAYAQVTERLRIVTYYPAPYGSYRQLRTDTLIVGSAYRNLASSSITDGDAFVSGRVNVGTGGPESDALSVVGSPVGYHTAAFRNTNDFGVAVGGLDLGAGPLSAGLLRAYMHAGANDNAGGAQPLVINNVLGGNVRIGGTIADPLPPYQLTLYCPDVSSCLGGRFNSVNIGVVRMAWSAGAPPGYYFKAIYDSTGSVGSPWTDNPLNAGTAIKAQHINELRALVDQKRLACGLSPIPWPWTNDPVVAGVTSVKAVHFSQIAAAIQQIYTFKGLGSTGITSPAAGDVILVHHITDLRNAITAVSCP
ncbi:MAG TPA: hypothetical protein VMD52_05365 [Patescibacteria group bacterium]|nr:hypothetical protein [Patescibacteria group bacterium]